MANRITDTKDIIQRMCSQFGHEEAAAPCIKKLVREHWLEKIVDLRRVPRERLESWGLPLKLVDEVCDWLLENEAGAAIHGMNNFINYDLKLRMQKLKGGGAFDSLRDDAEKRRNPKLWAVKKLQKAYRRRKKRREDEEAENFTRALLKNISKKEVCIKSEADAHELREKRAMEKLRRAVRNWRARRAAGGGGGRASSMSMQSEELGTYHAMCPSGAGSLTTRVTAKARHGELKDCEVTQLFRRFARKNQKEWVDMLPFVHLLVTFNWIESTDDLEIIEERHWSTWGLPEGIICMLKTEVELNQKPGFRSAFFNCCTGTGQCCLGDCCGAAIDWFQGYWDYKNESERQQARKDENNADLEEERNQQNP